MNPHGIRAFAPGRANLIGEHTDYNDGLCLPFAIEAGIIVTADPRPGGAISAPGMPDDDPYVRGAVAELRAAGVELPGCTLRVESDLPQEAGLSSSAALCVALVLALCGAAGTAPPETLELARLCSRIESEYTGAETGLLDQLASLLGEDGSALRIDFKTLEIEPVPLELGGWQLVTADSGAAHSHAEGGYNERRAECRAAAEALGVEYLSDADPEAARRLGGPEGKRARHVLNENQRVEATVAALHAGDFGTVGQLLDASHASLRDDFEASVPEVEATVERLKRAGAAGARMMGGGFGGAVLALLPPRCPRPHGVVPVAPGPAARRL
jgi:galactokinase